MHINQRVNTRRTQVVNQHFHLVQVCVVVHARLLFDGLPHYAEAHKVEAPLLHVFDVLSVQRVLRGPRACHRRNKRRNLVNSVHTVEKNSSAIFVDNTASRRVY